VRLNSPQASLRCGGLVLENLHGDVTLQGEFDGQHLHSRGELALDSLTYKDCQFAQVMGPIWIDDDRVLLGRCVDQRENGTAAGAVIGAAGPARFITANLWGGKLYADGWIVMGAEPRYAVGVRLIDAELARCAQDLATGRQRLRGKILATADLTGRGRTRNTLAGGGSIQLTDGDVYELPVMFALLTLLSIRPPDQNAFSTAAINYRIEGEHIYFDRIDFEGDAVSLRSKDVGEMDFQSQIRLTFYATVGRGELDLPLMPLFKQVFRGAAQQLLLIHVGGTLQNPEVSKDVLPAVGQTLQQLRGELEMRR
jgi:hypothetical protein